MKGKKIISLTMIAGVLLMPLNVFALSKNETVYSNLNYDGVSYKTVVSNHLQNSITGNVDDESELKNILNINGNESYTLNNNGLLWEGQGKDIYYQGETEKDLPITTKITYYLNGEEIDAQDIVGREGKVKVVFHFTNNEKRIVNVSGKNETLYTPFVTMVGTMLDGEKNSNITISSGKVISTGTRHMIVGMASPGLYESLGIKEFQKLNEISLEFETECFSLNNVYIVSTPKLLEETDLKVFDSMDSLSNDISLLQKNMNTLESGIKELESASVTLNLGTGELMNGLSSAVESFVQLQSGSVALDEGLKKVVTSLDMVNAELQKIDLEGNISQLKYLKSQNGNVINSLLANTGMTNDSLSALYKQYNLQGYTGDDENLLAIKSAYELITLLNANNRAIDTTIEMMNNFYSKVTTLIISLKTNFTTLSNGATKLNSGLGSFSTGINKVYEGSKALNQGTKQLSNGATVLSNGAKEFNNQGIKKLSNYANTLKNYGKKAEALINLSKEYDGFSNSNSDETLFIAMTKSLKTNCKNAKDID